MGCLEADVFAPQLLPGVYGWLKPSIGSVFEHPNGELRVSTDGRLAGHPSIKAVMEGLNHKHCDQREYQDLEFGLNNQIARLWLGPAHLSLPRQ